MECSEVLENISATIDRQIEETLESTVRQHLQVCPQCRNEFELEQITKNIVREKVLRVKAPDTLVSRISRQIAPEEMNVAGKAGWFDNILQFSNWKTAVGVGIAMAAIILFTLIPPKSHHSHAQPNDASIIHQTYNNFDGVLSGRMTPEESTNDPAAVNAYFAQSANFKVNVPRMKHCKLLGGLSSQYKNECLAHVVYKHGDDVIYIYQADLSSVMTDGILNLPPAARDELERTGWYVESHPSNCTLAIWIVDATICCAVADISKEQLLACLKGAD